MAEQLYKYLSQSGSACNGGSGSWPLPIQRANGSWDSGLWTHVYGNLVPCSYGLHLCREKDLLGFSGEACFEAEYDGERIDCNDKIVVRRARLVRKLNWNVCSQRKFAIWCCDHVGRTQKMHIFAEAALLFESAVRIGVSHEQLFTEVEDLLYTYYRAESQRPPLLVRDALEYASLTMVFPGLAHLTVRDFALLCPLLGADIGVQTAKLAQILNEV